MSETAISLVSNTMPAHVKEAAQFAVELTAGVNIVYDDLRIDLTENQVIH